MDELGSILRYWFGSWDDERPLASDDAETRRWWSGAPDIDEEVRERLGPLYEQAREGALRDWAETARGSLALVILLDQVPRNVHRGTAAAHATDPDARHVALSAVSRGQDRALTPIERAFLYLPLMHAENRELQRQSVELYEGLAAEVEARGLARSGYYAGVADFARKHAAVIERFGRFPSRNASLRRASTEAERAFLAEQGPGW